MAAKVINFHSPDGKNTYELTFTRDSVEATERAGFQIGQYTQTVLVSQVGVVLCLGCPLAESVFHGLLFFRLDASVN